MPWKRALETKMNCYPFPAGRLLGCYWLVQRHQSAFSTGTQERAPSLPKSVPRDKPYLALVSRHIQWTDAQNGIAIAKEAGFPEIMWTVRRGAQFDLSRSRGLPRIVGLTKAAGMETPMIITNIGDVTSDQAEVILATLQGLGIRLYRAAAPSYDYNAPFPPQYAAFKKN